MPGARSLAAWAGLACLAGGLTQAAPLSVARESPTPVRAFRIFDKKSAPELPESIVMDLLQDERGVLWIATIGGLATYDGLALRAVHDPQAPLGSWTVLAARAQGGLYASSRRGVHVFDGHGWRRLATEHPVGSLVEEGGRWLWAVFGGRAWRMPAGATTPAWQPASLPAEIGNPQLVLSDRAGGLFVLGTERYAQCRDGACALLAVPSHSPRRITAALATRAGALWVGTWDGRLQALEPGAASWASVDLGRWPSGGIRSFTEDRRGQVWAGGLARLCHGTRTSAWSCWSEESGLPNSAALSLLADREGTLWLGLNGAGLRQWVGEAWSHLDRWPGESSAAPGMDVTGVARTARGGVLASAFGRGVLRWEGGALTSWDRRDGLVEDIRAVVEPSPGVVWAAGRHGVFELGPDRRFHQTLALNSGFAAGFARDPEGAWHVWTDAFGIYRRGVRWEPAADLNALLPERSVSALGWTSRGEPWIGLTNELIVRRRGGALERRPLGVEHGMPESVSVVLEVAPDEIWVGGQSGIAILSTAGSRLLTEADAVPGNVYFLQRAPDGAVWVGGSKGIARYRGGRFARYDAGSGLLAAECNRGAAVFPDGSLFAGTGGSLAHFDASLAPLPAPELRVYWQALPDTSPDGVLRRAPGQRRLQLAWNAPWLAPQPIEYRTQVGEQGWSPPTPANQMTVENLAAGAWPIAVEARLAGVEPQAWSAPAALRVEVAPFFRETAAARATAAVLAAGLMLLAVQLVARRSQVRREQALSRLRSDFMASASHELRTPIAQIRLFADTLRFGRVRDEEERADALDTIHRATQRLETLAGNLLQLARGQAGAPAFVARPVDVAALLEEVVRDQATPATGRDATLWVEVEAGLKAHLDPEGLRQALSNLVDNALKYGPAGQRVRLGAEQTAKGLRLWVEDQGPGIPAAERERVWERFVRLDRDRHSAVCGTGIGLAVVGDMVGRAGGSTWIEDVSPTGTRVVILLPQPGEGGAS
jgi:signal transduction histidine kinase/ligand-binding sensor domain-containing protein